MSDSPRAWTWFRVPTALHDRLPELGRAAVVYIVLARHANEAGECWPSHKAIAEAAGISERSVRDYLSALKNVGLVCWTRRRRDTDLFVLPDLSKNGNPLPDKSIKNGSPLPDKSIKNGRKRRQERQNSVVKNGSPLPRKKNQEEEPRKYIKRRGCAARIEIPAELSTDLFRASWAEWLSYRRERRLTLSERTLNAQLSKLASWGEPAAVEAIQTSITNGWQGLFPTKANGRVLAAVGPGQRHPSDLSNELGSF